MKYESNFERREDKKYYIGEYSYNRGEEYSRCLIFDIKDDGMILKEIVEMTGNDALDLFLNYCI